MVGIFRMQTHYIIIIACCSYFILFCLSFTRTFAHTHTHSFALWTAEKSVFIPFKTNNGKYWNSSSKWVGINSIQGKESPSYPSNPCAKSTVEFIFRSKIVKILSSARINKMLVACFFFPLLFAKWQHGNFNPIYYWL